MRIIIRVIITLFLISSHSYAAITEQGSGMLFGRNHAFYFTAPEGWVLDNQSGVRKGLHMVFYPAGETWEKSPVVVYGRSVQKDEKIKSVIDQVRMTVEDFRNSGNPNYKSEQQPSRMLSNGSKTEVFFFQGDRWGNYEAAGYIEEENSINFIVFNARSKPLFDKYLPDFYTLFSSYRNAYNSKTGNAKLFNQLLKKAKQDSGTTEGNEYELKAINSIGQAIATFMKGCISYASTDEVKDFEVIFKVEPTGKITEAYWRPINTLSTCFQASVLSQKLPPHQFESFLLYIDMKVKE